MPTQSFRGWIEQFIGNSELSNLFYTGQIPDIDDKDELRSFIESKDGKLLSEFDEKYSQFQDEIKNYKEKPRSLMERFVSLLSAEGWCTVFLVHGEYKYRFLTMFGLTESGKSIGMVTMPDSPWFLPVDQIPEGEFISYCRSGEVEQVVADLKKAPKK